MARASEAKTIAVVGGSGNLGFGLALRWANNRKYRAPIGSRRSEKAQKAAREGN